MAKAIKCCQDCVPPVRHPGCHDTCKKYQQEKQEYNKEQLKIREARAAENNYSDYIITHKKAKSGGCTREC